MRFFCFLLGLLLSLQASAFSPEDLRAFGKSAPVQLYLFTSLSCPHCSTFHKKVLPSVKREYADTGKAQIIVVDMIQSENGLIATQILRCLDVEPANKFEDDIYSNQSQWLSKNTADAKRIFFSYAAKQGMNQEAFDTCLSNIDLKKAILEQQSNLGRLYGITGTPTLLMREGAEVRKWQGGNKKEIMKGLAEAFQK